MIDEEFIRIRNGTCEASFGRSVQDTSTYSCWKAEEARMFICFYAPILLQGHLPRIFMRGVRLISNLMELVFPFFLTSTEVEEVQRLSVSFFEHFESHYVQSRESRVHLCKSTVHAILHLSETIERCGPPVLYSQFWMERYVGFIKHRLQATTRAAECLAENAKLLEGYKLLFDKHFVTEQKVSTDEDDRSGVDDDAVDRDSSHPFVGSGTAFAMDSSISTEYNIPFLLKRYIMRMHPEVSEGEASMMVSRGRLLVFDKVRITTGNETTLIWSLLRARKNRERANYFIATEFDGEDGRVEVFYGRALLYVRLEYQVKGKRERHSIYLGDWLEGLKLDRYGRDLLR